MDSGLRYRLRGSRFLALLPIAGVGLILAVLATSIKLWARPAKTYGSSYPWIGKIKLWLLALVALTLTILAAARPYLSDAASSFERGTVDVAVVLDVSASMWIKDLRLSRLDLAVREILNLYGEEILRDGDRVALFVFGGTALRKVHLSSDSERFIRSVGRIRPPTTLTGDAFPWNTDPVAAFEHVYQSLDRQDKFKAGGEDWKPTKRSDRLVLLFSDGDYAAAPEQIQRLGRAMSEFERRGLKIYSIGIGGRNGVRLSDVLLDYKKGIDFDDGLQEELQEVTTQLDLDFLDSLGRRSSGRTFVIDHAELSSINFLKNVVDAHRSISLERIDDEDNNEDNKQEIWRYLLGLAILVFGIALVLH